MERQLGDNQLIGNNKKSKKRYIVFSILGVIGAIALVLIIYNSKQEIGTTINQNTEIENKEIENYMEIFYKNKDGFTELSRSLMILENDISITKESNEILVVMDGKEQGISENSLDQETKASIIDAMNNLDLRSIDKTDTYIEFSYNSLTDRYSIVYTADRNQLDSYTDIQDLGNDWYYCFIYNE